MNSAELFLQFLLGAGVARNNANLWPPHRRAGTPARKRHRHSHGPITTIRQALKSLKRGA